MSEMKSIGLVYRWQCPVSSRHDVFTKTDNPPAYCVYCKREGIRRVRVK